MIVLIKHGGASKVAAIQQARRYGDVVIVDDDPRVPCDVPLLRVEKIHSRSVIDAIHTAAVSVDAVLTFVDPVIPIASQVAEHFHLPALASPIVKQLKNKFKMREALHRSGIDYPAFAMFDSESSLLAAARHVGFPLVIKPATGGAYSLGVVRVDDIDRLLPSFRTASGELDSSEFSCYFSGGPNVSWMVEAYMPGIEVSVELMGHPVEPSVVTVHEKVMTERDGHFREDRFVTAPYRLGAAQLEQVRADAIAAAKALKFHRGVAHLEMRFVGSNAFPIELQAVPGGAMISEMTEWSCGVNLHALHTRCFLSTEVPPPPSPTAGGACAMDVLYAESPGIYRISGMDDAARIQGIERVKVPVAESVRVSQPFSEYLGFIVARGSSQNQALRALDQAREILHLEMLETNSAPEMP